MESKLEEGCCVVACERPLDAQYWDAQWKSNTIGWDLGVPAPPLVAFMDTIENKEAKILIPGCGNAYEAEYLVSKGFTNIALIDISETASAILNEKFLNQDAVRVLCEDFFELKDSFDIIIEQTFFCALPPSMRQRYVWKMHSLLNDQGILAGLLFNRQFDVSPPFGGSSEEYEKLFQTAFHIDQLSTANNSVSPRANSELFFSFVKNNSVMVNLYSFEGITCTGCKNSVTEIYSKIDGVIKVSMSSDFKEVLIVSDKEIDMKLLQELVSYEKDYKVISY